MLSLANIYTLYFRLYFRLCICLNKLSINQYNIHKIFNNNHISIEVFITNNFLYNNLLIKII